MFNFIVIQLARGLVLGINYSTFTDCSECNATQCTLWPAVGVSFEWIDLRKTIIQYTKIGRDELTIDTRNEYIFYVKIIDFFRSML